MDKKYTHLLFGTIPLFSVSGLRYTYFPYLYYCLLFSQLFCCKRINLGLFCFAYAADDKKCCEEADATTSVETEEESCGTILTSKRKPMKKVFDDFEGSIITDYVLLLIIYRL